MTAPPLDPTGADRRLRVVYCAVPNREVAETLAEAVVVRHLAACASHWPIASVYRWKGALERTEEHALLLKTSPKKLGALFRYLERNHPYDVPDIFEIHVPRVHEPYIQWVLASIDPGSVEPPSALPRAGAPTRSGSRRARGAPSRRRTRAPRRRR
jgi:periplasmic divalent cation tolerance protein